jgi:hypothetical protein
MGLSKQDCKNPSLEKEEDEKNERKNNTDVNLQPVSNLLPFFANKDEIE